MAEEKKKKTDNKSLLQIWVGDEKMTIAQTVQAQVALLALPTPEKYILQRKGRGGNYFSYVETNYVIGRLNATFMFDWDTEIIEQIIDKESRQIAIKVRLTVRFANGKEVKKDAWGGSKVKYSGQQIIDLADDLKAAESDGIKKAASMLGVCWDVYAGLTGNSQIEEDNGIADMASPPEDKDEEFRTIPITVNKETIMHTKFEALDRFKEAKIELGEMLYYKILGEHGYEKSNQIPVAEIPKLYYAMVNTYHDIQEKVKAAKKREGE